MQVFLLLLLLPHPKREREENLASFFDGTTGSFVLYDVAANEVSRYNRPGCAQRRSPCSTFKIPNSLIALETGVARDADFLIKWNGTHYAREEWNRDHTLRSAIANSVVWYYQELARRVGMPRMKQQITRLRYGNGDLSGGIDRFWLESSLMISADEEVDFLTRLCRNDLPFSRRSMEIVREILVLAKTDSTVFRGKTGSGGADDHSLGWFVGWVTKGEHEYIFATRIESNDGASNGKRARTITEAILRSKSIL
jgi:beta-lactamase class D